MNSKLSLQQFKFLFFIHSLCALLLATTARASASGTDIKDTNYPIPSGAYFVSPNGLESNSGKEPTSPWPVTKALTSASSGSTIVFRGGTYRNVKVSIKKKLTLQPYPHEKAWFKGSIEVQGWVADGARWRKDNWNYSFPSNVSSEYIDPNYPMAGYRDMVYINGVSLKQVASITEVVPGTFYVDSANKRLYIGDNPAGKTVEAAALTEALTLGKYDSSSDPSDTVIRGLGFAHYADSGINVGAPRVTIENNTFIWNGVEGVTFWGTSGGTLNISTDAIVRGNTFSYNARKGLGGSRAHRMLLEGNTISYNNVERFSPKWDAAGIKLVKTDGLIWRNNLVENNFACGMWLDVSGTNATIVHNTVRSNERYGILFEVSHKAIIAANVVYKNPTGIHISNSSSARVYNNTLVQNGHNLHIDDSTRNNTNANEIAAGITWIARDHAVKNNILSNPSRVYSSSTSETLQFHAANTTNESSSLMFNTIDYNGYYRTSSSNTPKVVRWSLGGGNSLVYNSVAAFNSATGFEAHALAIDNAATNPFFVDEANGDFRIKTGSLAIGRGDMLPPDIASAIGLPSGVKVDLGALQTTIYN